MYCPEVHRVYCLEERRVYCLEERRVYRLAERQGYHQGRDLQLMAESREGRHQGERRYCHRVRSGFVRPPRLLRWMTRLSKRSERVQLLHK